MTSEFRDFTGSTQATDIDHLQVGCTKKHRNTSNDTMHRKTQESLSFCLAREADSLEPGPSRARYFPREMLLLTTTARERAKTT